MLVKNCASMGRPVPIHPLDRSLHMKTAVIQFNAGDNKKKNFDRAIDFIEKAIKQNAKFILLPEIFIFRGNLKRASGEISETIPGSTINALAKIAKSNKVFILAGSIHEKVKGQKKVYNTSILIDDRGRIKAKYRKINLFDVTLGQKKIRESDCFLAGRQPVSVGVGGFKIGLSVCYDLRFPELYRHYAKQCVDILCVPSAFTYETGKAHWEVLLRARAIENFSYVLAPNQVGKDSRGIKTYGHSMIINPWGKILAQASETKEEIIYADLRKNFKKSLFIFLSLIL